MNDIESYEDYHFKSGELIYAAAPKMTGLMMDIFALMLTHMHEGSWEDDDGDCITPTFIFNTTILSEWFGVNKNQLSSCLRRSCIALAQKSYGFELPDGTWAHFPLLSKIKYGGGLLEIKPNPELKNIYLINISLKGHAKINNQIFIDLKNPNEKRVFEFLSRFKGIHQMYFTSVEKIQIMFGVIKTNGSKIKAAYCVESQFINKVLKPALIGISKCSSTQGVLTLKRGLTGEIGYELHKIRTGKYKIKFLVTWNRPLSPSQEAEEFVKIEHLISMYQGHIARGEESLETVAVLSEIINSMGLIGWERAKQDDLNEKMQRMKAKIKIKESVRVLEYKRKVTSIKKSIDDIII